MLRATCCALLLSTTLVACDGGGGGDPDAMPPDAPTGPDAAPEPDGPSGPGDGLVLDLPVLDFTLTEIGVAATHVLIVHNVTAGAIANVVPSISGDGFAIAATTCGALLDADASCTIDVGFAPSALGAVAGTLEVRGDGHLSSAAVLGVGARRITVARGGAGSGTITSSPAGIACGDTCSALFAGAASLTVAPAAGSELTTWSSGPCAGTATNPCLVPAGTGAVTAAAAIAIDSTITLTIVVTGDAAADGNDVVYDRGDGNGDVPCATGCSVDVAAGTPVQIRTTTLSTFGGWTGACSGAAPDCALTVSADATVTARFDRDDAERWTAFPGFAVSSVAFAPDGDVLVAGGSRIARYAADGASQRWSVTMPAPAISPRVMGLEADSTGAAFALVGGGDGASTATLSKLDSVGAVVWTRVLTGVRTSSSLAFPNQLAVTPADDIVVLLNTTTVWLAAYDGAGTAASPPLWTKSGGRGRALDVDETGTVYVAVANPPFEDCRVLRFSAAGEPLTDYGVLPGSYDATLAVAAGHLAASTSGFGHVTVSRDLVVLAQEDDLSPAAMPQGVAIDGAGFAAALRWYVDDIVPGMLLRRFLAAGTWTIAKPAAGGLNETGVMPAGLAARGDDIAVIGSWQGYQRYRPFVRVYGPPAP